MPKTTKQTTRQSSVQSHRICTKIAHNAGFHIFSSKKQVCTICQDVDSSFFAIMKHKRAIQVDEDYAFEETDDMFIKWSNTRVHFVIVNQVVGGSTSEKLMRHLTYARDGYYPGILVVVTNDDNVYCEKQYQYYKRKGGEKVFFVWQSRLPQLFKKLYELHNAKTSLVETVAELRKIKSTLATTRLSLQQTKDLARLHVTQRSGYTTNNLDKEDIESLNKILESVYNRIETLYPSRSSL